TGDIPGRRTAFYSAGINGDGRGDLAGVWSDASGQLVSYTLLSEGKSGGWTAREAVYGAADITVQPNFWRLGDANADGLSDLHRVAMREDGGLYEVNALRFVTNGDGTARFFREPVMTGYAFSDALAGLPADTNGDGQ